MRLDQIDRLPINESYVSRLNGRADRELVAIFREHNKLTGVPVEDLARIQRVQGIIDRYVARLNEDSVEVAPPTLLKKPRQQGPAAQAQRMRNQPTADPTPPPVGQFTSYQPKQPVSPDFDPGDISDEFEDELFAELDKEDCVLSLQDGADKLQHLSVVYIGLPAGYTCPFAKACKTYAHRKGKKFKALPGEEPRSTRQGPDADFECFAASQESQYEDLRNIRWTNLELINQFKGDPQGMVDLMLRSLSFYETVGKQSVKTGKIKKGGKIRIFRIHDSGDFFSQEYFDAWVKVATIRTDILFYAYTTSIPFWEERKDDLPKNFRLIASRGGMHDDMIDKNDFRQAIVVVDEGEALRLGLKIDVNEFLALFSDRDFALLLHNRQKKGPLAKASFANRAVKKRLAAERNVDPRVLDRILRKYTDAAVEIHQVRQADEKYLDQ